MPRWTEFCRTVRAFQALTSEVVKSGWIDILGYLVHLLFFWLLLFLVVVPLMTSCAKSAQVELTRECNQQTEEIDKLTLDNLMLRAERAFLRKLPELMQLSSSKSTLINSVRERKFGGSVLRVEATKEGFRWGWLLIELNSKAKSVQSIRLDPAGFGNAFSDRTNCFGEVSNLGTSLDAGILKD